jgi:hypothetical protein
VVPGGPYRYFLGSEYQWATHYGHSNAMCDAFGWLYFGSAAEFAAAARPPVARLYLDKAVYWQTDEAAEAYFEARWGTTPLNELRLVTTITAADGHAVFSQLYPGQQLTPDIGFQFRPGQLAPGDYTLTAALGRGEDEVVASATRSFTVAPGTLKAADLPETIDLTLTNPPAAGSGVRPISIGVPFPQGKLIDKDLANIRIEHLTPHGKDPEKPWASDWLPIDCQVQVRDRWFRGGSIRWLGIDFLPQYVRGNPRAVIMEWNKDFRIALREPRPEVADPLVVAEDDDQITITTGPMRAEISKTAFKVLNRAWLDRNGDRRFTDGELVVAAGAGDGLTRTAEDGAVYSAAHPRTRVWTEEVGPVKAIVVAEGWYESASGRREGRHQTRMFFYKGESGVTVKHTYIVTIDTHQDAIRNIAMRVGSPGAERYEFGAGAGLGAHTGSLPRRRSVYQLQARHDHYVVEQERAGRQVGEPLAEGSRAGGWSAVSSDRGTVLLSMRRLWQLYPKELEADRSGVALHIWPQHGRDVFSEAELAHPLNLPKCLYMHSGKLLKMRMPESDYFALGKVWSDRAQALGKTEIAPGRGHAFQFNYAPASRDANGQGLAMTTETEIRLLPPRAATAALAAQARAFQADVHGVADPKWTYATRVLGELWPQDFKQFGSMEMAIQQRFQEVFEDTPERFGDYGWLIWPDQHQYPNSHHTDRPGAFWFHRTWTNTHYQNGRTHYLLYIRSGDRRYWEHARNRARHYMDISTCNYATRPAVADNHTQWGMRHVYSVLNWAGDQGISSHFQNHDFKLWEYFLTGDRRGLDQARGWAEGMARETWVPDSSRDNCVPLSEALEVFQSIRDPRLLKTIHWFQDALATTPMDKIILPHYSQFLWERAWRYTRDPRIRAQFEHQWGGGETRRRHSLGSAVTRVAMYRALGDKRILATLAFHDRNLGWQVGRHPPGLSRPMMNAPYIMSILNELGATGELITSRRAYDAFWRDDFARWKQEKKTLYGRAIP